MTIREALLLELEHETANTRKTLERVPQKADYSPHAKSMPLGRLAALVAQLPDFGSILLKGSQLDFSSGSFKPLTFESAEQLIKAFDAGSAELRRKLEGTPEEAWTENWKLLYQGKTLFEGTRFVAYREMFLNHLVHHRAQLGVYLRLNDIAVPSVYGPSADEM
jgi:uncharacterized damage-inducible protein DinB